MSRYTNEGNISSGYRVGSQLPIDDRHVYRDLADFVADLNTSPDSQAVRFYEGMQVYHIDTDTTWHWSNTANVPTNTEILAGSEYTYDAGYPDPVYAGEDFALIRRVPGSGAAHSALSLDDGTNPHGTTKADVGLDQADNTADADKEVSTPQQAALDLKMDISKYDPDDNGVVDFAAQRATNAKNSTGVSIPAGTLVSYDSVDVTGQAIIVQLGSATGNSPATGITLEEIPNGETRVILLEGFYGPIDTGIVIDPGAQSGEALYLGEGGSILKDPPVAGLVQIIGYILEAGPNGVIFIGPQDADDRSDYLRDWRPFTPYEKDVQFVYPSDELPNVADGWLIHLRVKNDDYTSSNDVVVDYNAGELEIVGGDMHSADYDPDEIVGDVFDMDNMKDGVSKVAMTVAERTKLSGLEDPRYKGIYETPTTLRAAHPSSADGDSADVISTSTTWIWDSGAAPTPPTVGGDWVDSGIGVGGDMQQSVYDPTNVAGDAFIMSNMAEDGDFKIFTATERFKLDAIQDGAQVNDDAATIKTKYESNADTNAFTDLEKAKLGNIEDSAEVNQTDSEIKIQYENNADTNAYTDAEKSKLAGLAPNPKQQVIGGILKTTGSTVVGAGSGELIQATNLTSLAINVDSPAAGRVRSTIASNVMVHFTASIELTTTNDVSLFQIAVNGTPVTNATARASSPTNSQGTPESTQPTIVVPLALNLNDYVSVIHSGDGFSMYDMQLTINGQEQ